MTNVFPEFQFTIEKITVVASSRSLRAECTNEHGPPSVHVRDEECGEELGRGVIDDLHVEQETLKFYRASKRELNEMLGLNRGESTTSL